MTRNQAVRYEVNHRTTYRYSIPVSFSRITLTRARARAHTKLATGRR